MDNLGRTFEIVAYKKEEGDSAQILNAAYSEQTKLIDLICNKVVLTYTLIRYAYAFPHSLRRFGTNREISNKNARRRVIS